MRGSMLALILSVPTVLSAAGTGWLESYSEAAAAAKGSNRPILIDFQAVWCYSCYYMDERVLSKRTFLNAAKDLVLLKLDVDRKEGRTLRKKYSAWFLPSYVLIDHEGTEIGRIVGEQTEVDFMARLNALKGRRPSGAVAELRRHYEAGDFSAATALRRKVLEKDPGTVEDDRWRLLSARLDLRIAIDKKDARAVGAAVDRVLSLPVDCATPYDLSRARRVASGLPEARRKKLLRGGAKALERLAQNRLFGRVAERCADVRSAASVLAAVYSDLGLEEKRRKLLGRTIDLIEKEAGGRTGRERNRDDNLRFFLEVAGRDEALDELYPRLVKAYPADYVYAYRYAKNLRKRGKAAAALPWIKKASLLSYGANRLTVAGVHAEIFVALGRFNEARRLLDREIRANRTRFPEAVERLKTQRKKIAG